MPTALINFIYSIELFQFRNNYLKQVKNILHYSFLQEENDYDEIKSEVSE
jgi:hypothetical protein